MAFHEQEHETPSVELEKLSLFSGPRDSHLVNLTLGDFLDRQCLLFGENECIVTPWTGTRWTYNDIQSHSIRIAGFLLSRGIQQGDRVAILAGNRAEYASVFFACMRIGAILVILNNTYTTPEALSALRHTGMYCNADMTCRILAYLSSI